ncbi:uncharacterized mitochondrial protein AtMg00820-like [Aristolochia californica]|uniref:uncharacterized mitochondrial protein AtMg00820-like n=1 Tax=Aristolochia californica TaxID=171875 RepID=UPI0035D6C426
MNKEIVAIERNATSELTCLLVQQKAIGLEWLYKMEYKSNGSVDKLKERLVVKGYSQKPGIDYFEAFSLVACLDTICMILALTTQNRWFIHHMDVQSSFLNGILEDKEYVDLLDSNVKAGQNHLV